MNELTAVDVEERPLWRRIADFPLLAMAIALALIVAAIAFSILIAQFLLPPIPGLSLNSTVSLVALPVLVFVYMFGIARLGAHPRNDLMDPRAIRRLLAGLAGGALVFSAAVAIAAAMGVYRIVGLGDLSGMAAALIGSAIFPALSEETIFRGVLFRWLEEFAGSWLALLLTSALFGAVHLMNPNASPLAAIGIAFEAGVMLSAAYMLTRSLWLPMGLHAAWNFTQGEIYDIPVSGTEVHGLVEAKLVGPPLLTGNGFGLEASPIAMAVATAFGLWLLRLAIGKDEVIQPSWVRRREITSP